jgi:ATP-binding cassette subfamily B protein
MTNALVERMVGHRTRLAQERPEQRHEDEDQEMDRYLDASVFRDSAEVTLLAAVPQGWLVAGLLAMAPAFLAVQGNVTTLAISLGGIFLAQRAFKRLSAAAWQVIDARIAWEQLAPLMADIGGTLKGSPAFAVAQAPERQEAVLEAQELVFRYPTRDEPVLRHCSLRIHPGDRVLMEGASGGGKSTFVSLLIGIRAPSAGLLLAGGLDRHTLGADGWRRRVVAAPQFHLNHVITGPLLFNLMMGRRGEIRETDVEEALEICREMGLGDLLERMPGGLMQMVGETGWQLSQGERSRIFMARALLQDAGLVVLDESFAALDPETMQRALACVLARAKTLLVIAHQ